MTLRERAEREPLGVDISDYSDEWCAGFLAGQVNTLDALNLRTCPYCAHTVEWQDSDPVEGPCAGCRKAERAESALREIVAGAKEARDHIDDLEDTGAHVGYTRYESARTDGKAWAAFIARRALDGASNPASEPSDG